VILVKGEEKLVVFGYGRERLYTRERAKALARKITCELLTILILVATFKLVPIFRSKREWIKGAVTLTRTQFSMTEAYAITIHKSQGMLHCIVLLLLLTRIGIFVNRIVITLSGKKTSRLVLHTSLCLAWAHPRACSSKSHSVWSFYVTSLALLSSCAIATWSAARSRRFHSLYATTTTSLSMAPTSA
jgi:hypothetical protein